MTDFWIVARLRAPKRKTSPNRSRTWRMRSMGFWGTAARCLCVHVNEYHLPERTVTTAQQRVRTIKTTGYLGSSACGKFQLAMFLRKKLRLFGPVSRPVLRRILMIAGGLEPRTVARCSTDGLPRKDPFGSHGKRSCCNISK